MDLQPTAGPRLGPPYLGFRLIGGRGINGNEHLFWQGTAQGFPQAALQYAVSRCQINLLFAAAWWTTSCGTSNRLARADHIIEEQSDLASPSALP